MRMILWAVSIGDSAKIEVDALPDHAFWGIVSEIASSATISGSGTTDQKTEFEVKITVLEPGEELRPGMTASADIITETREAAIGVPIQCVTVRTAEQLGIKESKGDSSAVESDSTKTPEPEYVPDKDGFVQLVFVVTDSKVKAVQVKSGIQSETVIEILEGLAEDDEIVTGSYRAH